LLFLILSSCTTSKSITSLRHLASTSEPFDCRDSFSALIPANPIKSGPIKTGANSLGSKIPNFEDFRDKMLSVRPSLDNFAKNYKLKNNGDAPSIKQALDFYVNAHNDLVRHIRSAKGQDDDLDLYLEMSASEIELSTNRLEKVKEIEFSLANENRLNEIFNLRDNAQKPLFDSLGWTNYKGHLGELDVLLRLENLQAQGVYLSRQEHLNPKTQVVNDIMATALERKFESISESDISFLKEKYPYVFKSNLDDTDNQVLIKAKRFLLSKEFDLVIKKHNKYSIVEVKNYKHAININDVKSGQRNKKTIFDQQMETIQILHFLELDDRFFPTVAFLRGVTSEAKEKLERNGISVLAKVVD